MADLPDAAIQAAARVLGNDKQLAADVLGTAWPHLAAVHREKIRRQAANIDEMRKALERKNRELDALHLVWCDGSCPGGVHRWNPDLIVTEELVEIAERNARRLRSWYNGVRFRLGLKQRTADDWLRRYALRAAAKTDLATQEVPGER